MAAAAAHGGAHGVARVVWSRSLDPLFNLAWEDYLLRCKPEAPVCFLYRNAPCIVIGRNQNLWSELDAHAMHRANVPVVRRRSGGGTVYHDEGNVNFSFHVPRAAFARHTHTELVAEALCAPPLALPSRFGEPAVQVNERNDLFVYARDAQHASVDARRKISGSAYKISSQRAYHHGTLLVHADLGRMRLLRRQTGGRMTTKGIDSVASPVANLADTFPTCAARLTLPSVFAAIGRTFAARYGGAQTRFVDECDLGASERVGSTTQSVRSAYDELQTWAWMYGSSPEMQVRVTTSQTPFPGTHLDCTLHTERGVITQIEIHTLDTCLDGLRATLEALRGEAYDAVAQPPPAAVPSARRMPRDATEAALLDWLHVAL